MADTILDGLCEVLGWQGGTIHQALREVRRMVRECSELRAELDDLRRYKNEKKALVEYLGLPSKVCWGEVLTAIKELKEGSR